MPLPSPNKGEKAEDFHSRCMGDETIKKDFPDMKQRNAVCFNLFKDKGGKEKNEKKEE
jgi:hypothetical protein